MSIWFATTLAVFICSICWILAYPAIRNRQLMRGTLHIAQIHSVRRGAVTTVIGERRSPQMHFTLDIYHNGALSHQARASRQIPETIMALTLPGNWVEVRALQQKNYSRNEAGSSNTPKPWVAIAALGVSSDLLMHAPEEEHSKMPNKSTYAELSPERFVYFAPIMATVGGIFAIAAVVFAHYMTGLNYGGPVCDAAVFCCQELRAHEPKIESSTMRHCQNLNRDSSKGSCIGKLNNLTEFAKGYGIYCDIPAQKSD